MHECTKAFAICSEEWETAFMMWTRDYNVDVEQVRILVVIGEMHQNEKNCYI